MKNLRQFFDYLEELGVSISPESRSLDSKEMLKIFYKTYEADIIVNGFAVANGDPDGLYHGLGKHGSIASPMEQREGVADLLEEGRKITDVSKLDSHYKKVSRTIFEEVPYIHLGYIYGKIGYNKAKIKVDEVVRQRERTDYTMFSPR